MHSLTNWIKRKIMNHLIALLLFLSSTFAFAGNVQSLRTDADGNITASVRGEESTKVSKMPKQYDDSIVTFSSTPAGWSVVRAVFIPHQTSDGAWRLKFNISADSITSTATMDFGIDGVTFKNVSGYFQACTAAGDNGGGYAQATPNTGTVVLRYNAARTTGRASCDVELDSKPTWAE